MFDNVAVMAAIFAVFGYISGSFLAAYFIPKWLYGIDIVVGSNDGNPGTANVFKQVDAECGVAVIIIELLKGFLPVYIAKRYMDINLMWFIPVLAAPVIGHAHSMFYNFKGGKAIAVSFGVLLGLVPYWTPVLLLAFFYIFYSLIIRITPHWRRSVVTFISWLIALIMTFRIKSICIAASIISTIVVHKHIAAKD